MYGYDPRNCLPRCTTKCVGELVKKHKIYETCCYHLISVCSYCGFEFEHGHPGCPRCGAADGPPGDPPPFGGFGRGFEGFGRGFGRFGEFERFGRREFGEFREREFGEREREFGERRRFG